jgi:hypothetical protein
VNPEGDKGGPDKLAAVAAESIKANKKIGSQRPSPNNVGVGLTEKQISLENDLRFATFKNVVDLSGKRTLNVVYRVSLDDSANPGVSRTAFVKPNGDADLKAGKNARQGGFGRSWGQFKPPVSQAEREVITYELDRDALGLGIVAPSRWRNDILDQPGVTPVVKKDGYDVSVHNQGAVTQGVPGGPPATTSALKNSVKRPSGQRAAALDWIVGAMDRHMGNFHIDGNGDVHPFDNGLNFPPSDSLFDDRKQEFRSWLAGAASGVNVLDEVKAEILAIKPEKVLAVMQRYGFANGEPEATVVRLKFLQKTVEKTGSFPIYKSGDRGYMPWLES